MAPDWWFFSLDCVLMICHGLLIGKIPIASIAASTNLKLKLWTILRVVHHVLWQQRLRRKDTTWQPEGKFAAQRSATATRHADPLFSSRFSR